MIKPCLLIFGLGILSFILYAQYQSHPNQLYKQWIGKPIPHEVKNIEGDAQFVLTEPHNWLAFQAPRNQIQSIVATKGMFPVFYDRPWSFENEGDAVINGQKVLARRFNSGVRWFKTEPEDLEIYFINLVDPKDMRNRGSGLFYSKALQQAYWCKVY